MANLFAKEESVVRRLKKCQSITALQLRDQTDWPLRSCCGLLDNLASRGLIESPQAAILDANAPFTLTEEDPDLELKKVRPLVRKASAPEPHAPQLMGNYRRYEPGRKFYNGADMVRIGVLG
ncbi:MAG: hypothetical protein AAF358_13550 [Pseudomonadota bacterium]